MRTEAAVSCHLTAGSWRLFQKEREGWTGSPRAAGPSQSASTSWDPRNESTERTTQSRGSLRSTAHLPAGERSSHPLCTRSPGPTELGGEAAPTAQAWGGGWRGPTPGSRGRGGPGKGHLGKGASYYLQVEWPRPVLPQEGLDGQQPW